MARVLADVYLDGGRNVRLPTTPGRSVQFSGGHCMIVDGRDMPHVLQMEGARVFPRPDAMPWAPEWLANTDWIKAEVHWPEGWAVEHANKDEWVAHETEDSPSRQAWREAHGIGATTQSAPVSTVDMTDRQSERGIRVEDLLAEPTEDSDPEPRKRSRR